MLHSTSAGMGQEKQELFPQACPVPKPFLQRSDVLPTTLYKLDLLILMAEHGDFPRCVISLLKTAVWPSI